MRISDWSSDVCSSDLELAVTPAAVGQHIRALEDLLGFVLFRRTPKGLELTPETETGLAALRARFPEFEEAVRAMHARPPSNPLTIPPPRDIPDQLLPPPYPSHAPPQPHPKIPPGASQLR